MFGCVYNTMSHSFALIGTCSTLLESFLFFTLHFDRALHLFVAGTTVQRRRWSRGTALSPRTMLTGRESDETVCCVAIVPVNPCCGVAQALPCYSPKKHSALLPMLSGGLAGYSLQHN